jgi:hypothetical protein
VGASNIFLNLFNSLFQTNLINLSTQFDLLIDRHTDPLGHPPTLGLTPATFTLVEETPA